MWLGQEAGEIPPQFQSQQFGPTDPMGTIILVFKLEQVKNRHPVPPSGAIEEGRGHGHPSVPQRPVVPGIPQGRGEG
jgi:hypothetical protein